MTQTMDVLRQYPLTIDADRLRNALANVAREIELYRRILDTFQIKYSCDLSTFEEKIRRHEVPEHPSWETAIEWGVAQDEYDKLNVIRSALEWTLNFLN